MPRNMGSSSDSRRPRFGSKPGGGPGGGRGGPNRGGPHRGGKKRPFMRRKVCRFCTDQISYIDYKGSDVLRKFLTEKGKIIPRRTTGNCAKCQRKLVRAIKRARHAGLLAFQEV